MKNSKKQITHLSSESETTSADTGTSPVFESHEEREEESLDSEDQSDEGDLEHLLRRGRDKRSRCEVAEFREITGDSIMGRDLDDCGEQKKSDSKQLLIAPVSDRLKKFTRLSVPLLLSFVSMNLDEYKINFMQIGRVQDLAKLCGIGLGNMILNLLPYTVMLGLNTALEVKLYNAKSTTESQLYLYRVMALICCFYVPIAASFFYIEGVLDFVGVDEVTASYTRKYITWSLPAVLVNAFSDSIDLFLLSIDEGSHSIVVFILQTLVIPLDLVSCWYFVTHLDYGVRGAAIAINLTSFLTLACQLLYKCSVESLWNAHVPTHRISDDFGPTLKLALPNMFAVIVDNLKIELLVLLTAMLHSNEMLAAMIVLVTINQFLSMVPYALQLTTNMLTQQDSSQQQPRQAVKHYLVNAVATGTLCLACSAVTYMNKAQIVTIFTDDEEVSMIAEEAFLTFIVAFSFDWLQCCAAGILHGAGKLDDTAMNVCKLCVTLVSLLGSWYLAVPLGFGFIGYWLGYAATSLFLTVFQYLLILV